MKGILDRLKRLRRVPKYISEAKKYILLVLLPLFFSPILIAIVYSITNDQINDYGQLTTQYFKTEISSLFREVESITNCLVSDESILSCINAASTSDFEPEDLCVRVKKYALQSDHISDIYVCIKDQERIYSSRAYWIYKPFTTIIKSTELSALLAENGETGWHVVNTADAVPYYVDKISVPGREDVFIIVTIKMHQLLQFMNSVDARSCVLFNEDGYITPFITNKTDIDWNSKDDIKALLGANTKCFYSDDDNGYTYMVAVDRSKYYTPLRLVCLIFVIYFGVVTLIGFAYLCIASSREHKRLRELIEHLTPNVASEPSHEEMLASIKRSLQQYQDSKEKYEEDIQSNCIRHVLKWSHSGSFSKEQYDATGIPTDGSRYCIVSVFSDDYSDMFFNDGDESQNIDIARIIFRSTFAEMAAGRIFVCGTGLGRVYSSIFCIREQEEPIKLIHSITRDTMEFVERNYGLNLKAAVSPIVDRPCDISRAYRETEHLRDYIKIVGIDMGIISMENLTDSDVSFDGGYIKQLQILTNALNAEKYDIIPQLVSSILEQYVTNLHQHFHIAQSRIGAMTGILSEAILSCGIDQIDPVSLSVRFRDAQSVSEVTGAAEEIFPLLAKRAEDTYDEDPVNRARAFIKEHSADSNLSIPDISEHIGMSPQHLTRLFHKKLGITVADYLHSYRIRRSKELLAGTTLSVSSISQQVGYNSTNTFLYNFRRFEGISPSSYRDTISRQRNAE